MTILNILKTTTKTLIQNKTRTGLTILGIVIGIASIIIVFSAGEGISGMVTGQIQSFGTDIIETEIKVPSNKKGFSGDSSSGTAIAQGVQVTTLNLKDLEDIKKINGVEDGYAGIIGQELLGYEQESRKGMIMGTNASFIEIDKSEISDGRFFTDAEDRSLSQVIVLGSKMKTKLFGDNDSLGKFVRVRKTKYKVIGIMKERGAVLGMDYDDYAYVPIRTIQKRLMGIDHVLYMVHQLSDINKADEIAEETRAVLRQNHNISDPIKDDFRVVTMKEMISTLGTITNAITLLLLVIVAISLLVGGVGIMNVMYVIINERISEIGLRKAVGAKNTDILKQFLTESIVITMTGCAVGIVIGAIFSYLIFLGANYLNLNWIFSIPLKAFITSIGFSLFFGLFFGFFPARKAAKLEPIEALVAKD